MTSILVGIALLFGFVGFAMLSQATQGVGAVAIGCLFAILARIQQAATHHAATAKRAAPDAPRD
jgi:hypothetical protein